MTLDLNPRRRFPCYEFSPKSNFTFVPNHSSQYKGSLNSRSNNFQYKRPVFHNISHLVSALVCSFVLHMLKTDSYCSFQQNCYGWAKASLVIGSTRKLFQLVNRYLHSGRLMALNFVPARYARVQAKGSMCSPRGDWLRGGTRNQYWPASKSRECANF